MPSSGDLLPDTAPAFRAPVPDLGWPAFTADGPAVAPGEALGRTGSLEVRLARGWQEVHRAQQLRYDVFFGERGALAGPRPRRTGRDADDYDAVCDHLLVLDHACPANPFRAAEPKVVGTYRLLRREVAEAHRGFYSESEFQVLPLLSARPEARIAELGRACVRQPYRSRRTVELLWQGIWAYVKEHRIDALIGCASLDGTDPRALAPQLSYLHHFAPSPAEWRVGAQPGRRVAFDVLPREMLDQRAAFRSLPPLVKGYLRVGATVGDGAVVDPAFGTTDVFVVLDVRTVQSRYLDRFGSPTRLAA
ncbi:GNAT family N-acyltransferase [Enterovirga sp.]|jgi:putative hemolysin|uniref:GNAT family N-acetyltransferase n=1 Tax=Enterovirga sp. TaxID=2026350 RepID=UPI0026374405|nr:GNAT family N-acyltransferase [Enterovirga sp.]MDB5590624.1 ornithine--acyl-ACP N-acyltransferase OlsB [Enterovirga sp.]